MLYMCQSSMRGLLSVTTSVKGFLLEACRTTIVPVATLKNLRPIEAFEDVELPEKRKLKFFSKVPKKTRYRKSFKSLIQIRGPSEVANQLKLGQYGIVARSGGYLHYGHFEMMRLTINRFMDSERMFSRWRVEPPHKPITKKGQGQRMGGGKGNVDHYVTPVKANRMILEVAGKAEFSEIRSLLVQVAKKLPFRTEVVTAETMRQRAELEASREADNANPWTFKEIAQSNYLGIANRLGPYDYKWFGKFR